MKTRNVPDLILFVLTASNYSTATSKSNECHHESEKFCNKTGECRQSKYSCLCVNAQQFHCDDKRCVDRKIGCQFKNIIERKYLGECIRGYEWCSLMLRCVRKDDYDQRCKFKPSNRMTKCSSFKKVCNTGNRMCIDPDEYCPDERCSYNLRRCGYKCYADSAICEMNLQSQCDGSPAIRCNSDNNVLILFYIIIPILLILLAAYGMYQKFIKSVRSTSVPFINYGLANISTTNRDSNLDVECSASSSESPPKYEDVVKDPKLTNLREVKNVEKNISSCESQS